MKLDSVSNFERGITFPASAKEYELSDNNIPCIRTANIQEDFDISNLIYVDKKYIKNNKEKMTRVNDIIMSSANSRELVGKVSYIFSLPFEMTFGGFVITIRSKRCVLSKYLYYHLKKDFLLGKYLNESTQTTNLANINTAKMSKWNFPLAPLLEQHRIVSRIESLFAKLDEAKGKIQNILDGADSRKAAILHQAFTGKLTAKWRKENGVSDDSWEYRTLRKCGDWNGGGTPSTKKPEYWNGGDILWITSKDMKTDIIKSTQMYINMHGVANSSAIYNDKPSVLFVMRSGILRRTLPIAVVKQPFTVNKDLKAVTPTDINIDYLFWVCKSFSSQILNDCMKNGTTVESIDSKKLLEFIIPVASLTEQLVIVNIIKDKISNLEIVNGIASNMLTKIETMKKSILAKAFRGELGTNNPAEESAKEVLREIISI